MPLDRRGFLRAGVAAAALPLGCAGRARTTTPARRGLRYQADGPTVMLGAHCDDLPFHCWHYLTTVRPLVAVSMFMGIPPPGTMANDPRMGRYDVGEYMRVRHAEEREVLALAGAGEPRFLSGLDMPYRADQVPNLGRLAGELMTAVPSASVLVAPLGLGNRIRVGTTSYSHVDHKFVRDVADSFADIPKVYFAEIYALSKASPDYRELLEHMRSYEHWKLTRVDLTPRQVAAKRAALRRYRSQMEGLLADVPDILSDGVLGSEFYWTPG